MKALVLEPKSAFLWLGKRANNRSCRCGGENVNCPKSDSNQETNQVNGDFLSVRRLADAKKVALRRGVWFRALNRVERGVLDLTVKFVDKIRSATLATVVTAILDKLTLAMESTVDRLVRTVGMSLAQKVSTIAVSWGNRLAQKWANDRDFARFLAFNLSRPALKRI
jgi:hypothetical protein